MTRILGAVFAGGQSRRFGSDKAVADYCGRPMIDHVVDWVNAHTDRAVVCGRHVPGLIGLMDRPAPDLGPLGGLNAALHYGQDEGFDFVLSVPCDTPVLPDDLVIRLRASGAAAYVADLPVIGLWPVRLAASLDRHLLSSADHSLRGVVRIWDAKPIVVPVKNINRPADLVDLRALEQP